METTDIAPTKSSSQFFKHMFGFNEDYKSDVFNVVQYAILALVPVVSLNKIMQKFVPEADDEKGSFELLAEVVVQIVVMFLGLIFIDRVIIYIPTYSGIKYKEFSVQYTVLAILMIILSLQTKLGEKVGILYDRVSELWEGKREEKGGKKKKLNNVKVKQPIAQNFTQVTGQGAYTQSITGQTASFNDGTSINSLPTADPTINNIIPQTAAAMNAGEQAFEPMAANAALGGGAFSNW